MESHMYKSLQMILTIIITLSFSQILVGQEKNEPGENNSVQDIYNTQYSPPAISFKFNSTTLAKINEETDGRGAKFGSLSLTKPTSPVGSDMSNKIWLDRDDQLMFGTNPISGWWTFSGATLSFPSGYMVLGNLITQANNATIFNVLGRAKVHSFRMADGTEGAGKVLTSDANGVATWEANSSGGSIGNLSDGHTTESSVYLGYGAGESDDINNSGGNVGVGINALYSTDNDVIENTAVGYSAMTHLSDGIGNTAVGFEALKGGDFGPLIGNYNTAIGSGALRNNTDGHGNVAIGFEAGRTSSGNDKLYVHNSNAGTSSLIYGDFFNAELDINGELTVLQGIYGTLHGDSYGTNYPSSDRRFKKDIAPINNPIEYIQKLRGVTYNWRKNEFPSENFNNKKQIGLIAQEVEEIYPELVHTRKDGYKGVEYSKFTAILIEAVKEQQQMIEELQKQNSEARTQNSDLKKRLSNLESLVNTRRFTKAD